MGAKKSEWVKMVCDSERTKDAIRSWFSPLCDAMTPESADVLEVIETGRTKKARAVMFEPATGLRYRVVRRYTKRGHDVSINLIT